MRSDTEKEYLLKAIDATQTKLLIISPDFTVLAVNKYTLDILGRDPIGRKCHEVYYERSTPCEDCPASEAMNSRNPVLSNAENHCPAENKLTCRYSYPIFSDDKIDAIGVLEFEQPSREEMEEKLQRSNAFLRNLLLSSVDAVIAADKTGQILLFNDAAAEISGYSVDEALNSLDIRDLYKKDGAGDIMRRLRSDAYGGKGKLKSFQVDFIGKCGEIIPILLNAAILYEGEKEVGSIGFFHDMREELKIKAEMEQIQVQLLQAEKMSSLGKLSAGVAHQLNNPLGGITLFAKLLLEEYDLQKEAQEDIKRILTEAERCRDTVKELLEFARQKSNIKKLHDINQALSRTLFLLENQTLFQNIRIDRAFDDTLPEVSVDIQQMNHVFMNIILNAAQAMEGHGELSLKTTRSLDGEHIVIQISDTGPGMPEDVLNHIFEPFYTTKEEGKGTGLGLSLVYGIIEDHGGRIKVESKSGKGATFIITIPVTTDNGEGSRGEE